MASSTLSAANAVVAGGLTSACKVEIGNPTTRASRVFACSKASTSSKALKSVAVRAQSESQESSTDNVSRRAAVSALAAAVAVSLSGPAFAEKIKIEGPPPLFGGLPGTGNADEARDLDKPLKERFFLQQLPPAEAIARVKSSTENIKSVKPLIEKKQWPYVQNELRNQAGYLRFDLANIVASKPKEQRKALIEEEKKVFESIEKLDYAARAKKVDSALSAYDEAVPLLQNFVAKLS